MYGLILFYSLMFLFLPFCLFSLYKSSKIVDLENIRIKKINFFKRNPQNVKVHFTPNVKAKKKIVLQRQRHLTQ